MLVKLNVIKNYVGNNVSELATKVVVIAADSISSIDSEWNIILQTSPTSQPMSQQHVQSLAAQGITAGSYSMNQSAPSPRYVGEAAQATCILMKGGGQYIVKNTIEELHSMLSRGTTTNRMRGASL